MEMIKGRVRDLGVFSISYSEMRRLSYPFVPHEAATLFFLMLNLSAGCIFYFHTDMRVVSFVSFGSR